MMPARDRDRAQDLGEEQCFEENDDPNLTERRPRFALLLSAEFASSLFNRVFGLSHYSMRPHGGASEC